MAGNLRISTACRNAACDSIVDLVDVTTNTGICNIYTGAAPASTTAARSGTLLATLTFATTAFGAASVGVATANSITSDTNVDATGTAGYFSVTNGSTIVLWQGTVGTTTGTDDIKFDSVSFVATGTAAISSWTVTMPST
jgi:hypothetical protein